MTAVCPTTSVPAISRSGGSFALPAARALIGSTDFEPEEIAKRAMATAADICIYTNENVVLESLTIE